MLWPARFACLSDSKLWGTLANVPKVQSAWSPALFCSCLSDLHCLWACASGTLSRNQKAWKTAPCVQPEKAQNRFNKGFVNWFLEPLVACQSLSLHFRNKGPNWNKKVCIWDLLGLQPQRHRFKKHLNCLPLAYKTGAAYKGKNCKVSYMGFLSRIFYYMY